MSSWNGIYGWAQQDTTATRLRRLERGRQTLKAGQILAASGNYSAIPSDLLSGNNIDLTSTAIATQGSIPPFGILGKFGFTATATSITVYWDGTNGSTLLQIVRANQEIVHIPGNSLTISGLSPATAYGFLPFRSVYNDCGLGWVIGDVGSPQFAFTASARTNYASMQQLWQGREQLTTGFITYSTPASGSTTGDGGGSGGGGGGRCVMLGTDIEPLGDNTYATTHYQQNDWTRIQCDKFPKSLNCTPNHWLISPENGKQQAGKFNPGDWIITDEGERKVSEVRRLLRVCTKVEVKMPSGHLYFANGYLSHNSAKQTFE